jgi:hypothetical protein
VDPAPAGDDDAAAARSRELYTDPVTVNGTPVGVADLVARARAVQHTSAPAEREVLAVADELGVLTALDAVRLRTPADSAVAG